MQFFAMARIYRKPGDAISLRDVWTITNGELSKVGEGACKRLGAERRLANLASIHLSACIKGPVL